MTCHSTLARAHPSQWATLLLTALPGLHRLLGLVAEHPVGVGEPLGPQVFARLEHRATAFADHGVVGLHQGCRVAGGERMQRLCCRRGPGPVAPVGDDQGVMIVGDDGAQRPVHQLDVVLRLAVAAVVLHDERRHGQAVMRAGGGDGRNVGKTEMMLPLTTLLLRPGSGSTVATRTARLRSSPVSRRMTHSDHNGHALSARAVTSLPIIYIYDVRAVVVYIECRSAIYVPV